MPASPRRMRAARCLRAIDRLARRVQRTRARSTSDFLYDTNRHLFAIGYNVSEAPARRRLLRPARVRSAPRQSSSRSRTDRSPQERWFALGRLLTARDGEPALLSWSGSMFEYLMPLLVMPAFPGTLLDADLPRRGRAADRLRETPRRAVGHFRIRLQPDRCGAELPVPRVRRAGPRPASAAWRKIW